MTIENVTAYRQEQPVLQGECSLLSQVNECSKVMKQQQMYSSRSFQWELETFACSAQGLSSVSQGKIIIGNQLYADTN